MLIPVSLRSIRAAIGKAQSTIKQKFEEDKAKFAEASFNQLHDGAVHNGLTPSAEQIQTMRDMVARDVDHATEQHESTDLLKHLETMAEMADYFETHDEDADAVVISAEEFRVLKAHLNGDED